MFKRIYTGFAVGSTILGITGLIQCYKTTGAAQLLALVTGVGGTTAALTTVGLGIAYGSQGKSHQNDFESKLNEQELVHKRHLESCNRVKDEQNQIIIKLQSDLEKHKTTLGGEIKNLANTISERETKINELQAIVDKRDNRIKNFLEETRGYAKRFLIERKNRLVQLRQSIQKTLLDEIVPLSTKIPYQKRLNDVEKLINDIDYALSEIELLDISTFNEVIDYLLNCDNRLINIWNSWKSRQVKDQRIESQTLRAKLDDSMPKNVALERFNAGLDEYDQALTARLDKLLETNDIYTQLIENLEQRNLKINECQQEIAMLQQEITELQKPLLAIGTSDYALAANRVANYYYDNYGYRLDVIHWQENEVGYSILFATRRNPGLTESELLPHNTREQLAAFTNSLQGTLPQFNFNYQHSTVTLEVVLRKPIKRDTSKQEIDRLWIPVERFENVVRKWERIRITAGSTGGKSPTAKNIALAIMKSRGGNGVIKLYDPQHGSKKDYWNMPKAGITHEDNLKGMTELCALIDERRHGSNHQFMLYIFDEVDNTVTQLKQGSMFKDLIKQSLKEGSHASIGAIYIGQSSDANEVPGMTHSNWNNAVQVHIGANVGGVLDTIKTLTTEDKTKQLERYHKLQTYCDKKNDELGLDIFTDAGAYRFALVVELNGKVDFLQLPDFDSYDYNEVMILTNNDDIPVRHFTEINPEVISCIHCGSTNTFKNGFNRKQQQLYSCKDCQNKPKKFISNTNDQNVEE